jgi:single-strand DNA-binding protein
MLKMNSVILIGRMTKAPEIRFTQSGKAVANFSIAVDRDYSKEKKTDFFNVQAWGKQAESCATYLDKGLLVGIKGSIQTGSYEDKNNVTKYTTDIVADQVQFLEWKDKENTAKQEKKTEPDFNNFSTVTDEDVPF